MPTKTPKQAVAPGHPVSCPIVRALIGALALAMTASLPGCFADDSVYDLGCKYAHLRPVSFDPGDRGPWRVGVRTVEIGSSTVEVWYPAQKELLPVHYEPESYDLRQYLHPDDASLISDFDSPWQICNCHRDLVPDLAHGPYPVVVFLHGEGGFRTQSLPQVTHWASRGFIVLAADLPGLRLEDALASACNGAPIAHDARSDAVRMILAVRGSAMVRDGALAFLHGSIDAERIAVVGHAEGGSALASLGNLAQVLVPMAAAGVEAGKALRSTLILGGTADSIVSYETQGEGFSSSPSPKRLVGIRDAGHLSFTEICELRNGRGQSAIEVLVEVGVCGAEQLEPRVQCDPDRLSDPWAWSIIDTTTAAALGETLQCQPRLGDAFDTLLEDDPEGVAEVRQEP
ncbi:alpha/beta hydrolase [Paraliomyxa miuraensis]|uniref:alpha/beta hydrolase n=1 Tax=Paraliomyxa miuraensis TaxID=376150 RepID=UPI00225320AF|nr:hypothetical protein [Paraliomyxa miuraensis]MCX4246784.1 hypothetical protein [Paraliomyxa miuraensis]